MPKVRQWILLVLLAPLFPLPLVAQDAQVGVAMPVTLSAEGIATQRLRAGDPSTPSIMGAFRAMFYPTAKLGSHWMAYSAIQVSSEPFFYYQSYYTERNVDVTALQSFVGYTNATEKRAWSIKAGKLSSAFGSFPLRYDDASNPLLDQPLSYGRYVKMRPDQLPCGVADILRQRWFDDVNFSCGGATTERYGISPATLYGLPGAEIDYSFRRLDTRFQLTNSSPANPQMLLSGSQNLQWTAGAGVTIQQGFRVGFSAFRGAYLEDSVRGVLPAGKGLRDYPATGRGIDVQWARGRWSANGEWQWFEFQYPGFRTAPAVSSGYIEAKAVVTPRLYAAVRATRQGYNRIEDAQTQSSRPFQQNHQAYEFALGFHVNHFQLVKAGYEWVRAKGIPGSRDNIFGIQFVTSIDSLYKAIK